MLDIRFICDNPELVKDNIKKKFEDKKLPMVDEVISLYNACLWVRASVRKQRSLKSS